MDAFEEIVIKNFERIEGKLDKVLLLEDRVSRLEKRPKKMLSWVLGLSTVGATVYKLFKHFVA